MLTAKRTSRVVSKRKFREHGNSYASYKKHKSEMGSLGNPKLATAKGTHQLTSCRKSRLAGLT